MVSGVVAAWCSSKAMPPILSSMGAPLCTFTQFAKVASRGPILLGDNASDELITYLSCWYVSTLDQLILVSAFVHRLVQGSEVDAAESIPRG